MSVPAKKVDALHITDADRDAIAKKLKVKVESVRRMEPRIFANDVAIAPTDSCDPKEDRGNAMSVARGNVISVEGGQKAVERVTCAPRRPRS